MTTSALSKLLSIFSLTSTTFIALTIPFGLIGIYPTQVNAQGCKFSNTTYRLMPARTEGPWVTTDGKVYKGEYQGSNITLCNGIKIKPKSGCEKAYQWTNSGYKYQLHLLCSNVGSGNDFEAKLLIKQNGEVILDDNLYFKAKAR
jgi:hypothetical protein